MGTVVRITLYANSAGQAQRAFLAAFARIAGIDERLSDYKPSSELNSLGAAWRPVSHDLARVLRFSQELARRSNGAFDITAGPYVRLWRAARRNGRPPGEADIEAARPAVGSMGIEWRGAQARLTRPGMQLDLGGVAKGYAADEALAALRRHGIRRALVAVSGDIAAGDAPPDRTAWRVEAGGRVHQLRYGAISTSGSREQFLDFNGTRYSHIVDPRTGRAVTGTDEVTVLARDGMTADALATALSVDASLGAVLIRRYKIRIL